MKKTIATALILAATASLALAQDNSISGKEMQDSPTTMGGKTDMPNAKPDTNSVSGKEMKDSPGVQGAGKTDMPNAKPTDGSVVEQRDAGQSRRAEVTTVGTNP